MGSNKVVINPHRGKATSDQNPIWSAFPPHLRTYFGTQTMLFLAMWYSLCYAGALLAFNRYVELRSSSLAERLFAGNKCWLWLMGPLLYGIALSTSIDVPPIYNSVSSVFFSQ